MSQILHNQKTHPEIVCEYADLAEPGEWRNHFDGAVVVVMLQAQIGGNNYHEFIRNNIDSTNNILNEVIPHAQVNLTDVDKKTFKFHNLKYRWTHDKFYTQYYLDEYDLINDNIITYQSPSKFDPESGQYVEMDPNLRSDVLLSDKSITADKNIVRKMVSALETF